LARGAALHGSTSRHSPWSKPANHLKNTPKQILSHGDFRAQCFIETFNLDEHDETQTVSSQCCFRPRLPFPAVGAVLEMRHYSLQAEFIQRLGRYAQMIFIACAATVIAAGVVRAADDAYATQTVSEFLAICQNDIKKCYGDVNAADSMAMLQSMGNPGGLGYCEPDNISEEDHARRF
jgi:hypothetical protein